MHSVRFNKNTKYIQRNNRSRLRGHRSGVLDTHTPNLHTSEREAAPLLEFSGGDGFRTGPVAPLSPRSTTLSITSAGMGGGVLRGDWGGHRGCHRVVRHPQPPPPPMELAWIYGDRWDQGCGVWGLPLSDRHTEYAQVCVRCTLTRGDAGCRTNQRGGEWNPFKKIRLTDCEL